MTNRQSFHPTVYFPDELSMLTRVCRKVRKARGIEANGDGAKEIADLAFVLYSSGIDEEKVLVQKLRQRA
ncbi:hypothetical protein [Mesorhizobium sp. DCY119]|uniref:hypothetical protein n=1 Tax=Mesorhizobium sp. DCY119 TaxID=2108445 RepID=UPI000E716BEE|nr:hypothetical protein [Mesorhizobium sp. DCY119]RJG46651.1 hypothetical protein D3Y55_21940 [Mesorhizobium sp. DCY119]